MLLLIPRDGNPEVLESLKSIGLKAQSLRTVDLKYVNKERMRIMSTRIIKPYIDVDKKEVIVKLNFLTGLTIKKICNDLLDHAVMSNYAMFLTQHFKRSVTINKLQFPAQSDPVPFPEPSKDTTRVTLSIDSKIHEYANSLYYATDVSVPKIIASMINYSINDSNFFDYYVTEYLSHKIDDERKLLLRSILKDINGDLDRNENIATLLFYIADEVKDFDESIEEGVEKFVSRWTAVQ